VTGIAAAVPVIGIGGTAYAGSGSLGLYAPSGGGVDAGIQRTQLPAGLPLTLAAKSTATYVVKSGDTLSRIAAAHKVSGGWQALWKLNRSTVGSNPNLIYPNQKLQLVAGAKPAAKPAPKAATKTATKTAAKPKSSGWVLPLTSYHLTARFGQVGGNWGSFHHGLDFAAPTGTPIHAVGAGEIVAAGWDGAYGNRIKVRHSDGTETLYGHMSRFARTSGSVSAGTVIGYVGATGNVTGPHCHLEVRPHGGGLGDAVDPYKWLVGKGLHP